MIIKRGIKLGNNNYYIQIECVYKKDIHHKLCMANYLDDYFDSGDLSKLIEKIEKEYNSKIVNKTYGNEIAFLADCLYLYDYLPFIEGVGLICFSTKTKEFKEETYIDKKELDKYIKENNIKMQNNKEIKLYDERTWNARKKEEKK